MARSELSLPAPSVCSSDSSARSSVACCPCVYIVMGVSGSGKSSVSSAFSEVLRAQEGGNSSIVHIEGDDFHSKQNVQKMSAGIPLTDDDRRPWLDSLHVIIEMFQNHHRKYSHNSFVSLPLSYSFFTLITKMSTIEKPFWQIPFADYSPSHLSSPLNPPRIPSPSFEREMSSQSSLNPFGRTGRTGLSNLSCFGANHSVSILLTLNSPSNNFQVYLSRAKNGWEIPKLQVDEKELRDLKKTAGSFLEKLLQTLGLSATQAMDYSLSCLAFLSNSNSDSSSALTDSPKGCLPGCVAFQGYYDDWQVNTDHAWKEITVIHIHLDSSFPLISSPASLPSSPAQFQPLTEQLKRAAPANEPEILHTVHCRLLSFFSDSTSSSSCPPFSLPVHPLLSYCRGASLVVACSALKRAYRRRLVGERTPTVAAMFLLDVERDVLEKRMQSRRKHFMKANMLESQLSTLERFNAEEETEYECVTLKVKAENVAEVCEIMRRKTEEWKNGAIAACNTSRREQMPRNQTYNERGSLSKL